MSKEPVTGTGWSENGVRVEARGAVFEITLDRPKANAINTAVSRSLARAFMEFRDTPACRVALVTGGGARFFSAGWDLKSAAEGEAVTADHSPGGFAGLTELFDLEKPVIAVVNGLAVGGGFELALACDLIVAAEHAEFFFPESGLGIIPDSGGVLRLPKKLPQAIALEMLYTGRRMDSAQAQQLGLVNRVAPIATLMECARILAQEIATKAPLAIQAIKCITTATAHVDPKEGYRILRSGTIPAYQKMLDSQDAKEGIAAYGEGREPRWRGV